MQIPAKLLQLVGRLAKRGPRAPRQMPLDYGPGFLAINGGGKGRIRLPRQPLRLKEAYGKLNPYLRRAAVPGAILGGAIYGSRKLEGHAQLRVNGVKAYTHAVAREAAIPGGAVAGARARMGIRGSGFHAGVYAKGAKRSDGTVAEAGKAGAFLRSKPVGGYLWVGGRKTKVKAGHDAPEQHLPKVPAGRMIRGR